MSKLVDMHHRPIGKKENDPPQKNSPEREILRVLRIVETARRTSIEDLCATLHACLEAGWGVTLDDTLPEFNAEISMINNISRDVENKLIYKPQRWIRLGKGFAEAMSVMQEEKLKQEKAQSIVK